MKSCLYRSLENLSKWDKNHLKINYLKLNNFRGITVMNKCILENSYRRVPHIKKGLTGQISSAL